MSVQQPNPVDVMDEILYNSLSSYYHALGLKGYMPHSHAQKLLLLVFYRDFTLEDYRGRLSREDYRLIERALDCLWGSTCLIPYPDYLKMGRLCLGGMTEMARRIKALEDAEVLKAFDADGSSGSDIVIMTGDDA